MASDTFLKDFLILLRHICERKEEAWDGNNKNMANPSPCHVFHDKLGDWLAYIHPSHTHARKHTRM